MTRELTGDGERRDVSLSRDGELSRSRAAALIREGRVTVNGKRLDKPSFKADVGAVILLDLPEVKPAKAPAKKPAAKKADDKPAAKKPAAKKPAAKKDK